MEPPEIKYLYNLRRFGMKLDLTIMNEFVSLLGNPHENFRSVHVAGTNGKGSVCAYTYSILRQRFSTGLYTSPHLVRFNERIVVDDEEIDDEYVISFVKKYKPLIERLSIENRNPTFFEVTTGLAFQYFALKNVDFGVFEVGLGGRLDATNVLHPEVSAIVTIDYDHTHILGDTLEKIAAEKAGIIKPNIPVVVGENKQSAVKVIKEVASKSSAPYHNIHDECSWDIEQMSFQGTKFSVSTPLRVYNLTTPLAGAHQVLNAVVSVRIAEILSENTTLTKSDIEKGIGGTKWRDRFEVKRNDPLLIFDSAHNPAGARALVETVKKLHPEKFTLLFSMVSGKNIHTVLSLLKEIADTIVVTEINYERRRLPLKEIEAEAKKIFENVVAIKEPCRALQYIIDYGKDSIATGSIYLLGELEQCLRSLR